MSGLTGTRALVRLVLRRDRIRLPIWIVALLGTIYASAGAVANTYDTPLKIASYANTLGTSPATIAVNGPAVALDTQSGILIYETSLTALIGTALMVIFLVVRHTRSEEEAGRTELLASTVVGRHAAVSAAVFVGVASSAAVGCGVGVAMLGAQMPASGAWLFAASVAAMGVVFTGVAACAAQIMTHSRGAIGLSLAVLGLSYLLRAIGDVRNVFWSWLSPMGWSQQVRALDENRWWPLLISMGFTAVLLVAVAALASRRDLGAGIIAERPGPAQASASLGSAFGLAWRLQRATILAWALGVFVAGLMFGSLSREVQNMVKDNPTLADYFERSGGASLVDAFFATSMLIMSLSGTGFAVASAFRTRGEESADRLEQVLATGVSRSRWLLESLVVTLVGSAVVVGAGGFGVGFAFALVSGDASAVIAMTGYSLVYLPAVLVVTALAVLLVGWAPRAAPAAWGAVAVCFVIGWLGGLLNLPRWFVEISPFTHTPQVPAQELRLAPLVALLLIAALGTAAGTAGFRRRDIG